MEDFYEPSKLRVVSLHLTGAASAWWEALLRDGTAPKHWKAFKKAFHKQFLPKPFKDQVVRSWDSLHMEERETIDEYNQKFWDYYLQVLPFRRVSKKMQLEKYRAGLNMKIQTQELEEEIIPLHKVQIFCSPFSRTRDTAETVADLLGLDHSHIEIVEELRERYFGPALELQSHDHYPEIWALDEHDPLTGPVGGESVADVSTRLAKLLPRIESDCQGCAVLIVSHGDTLQILQTIVLSAPLDITNGTFDAENLINASILSEHRKYSLLTGELRRLG